MRGLPYRGARGAGDAALRRRLRSRSTTLRRLCREAYAGFGHPAVAPLVQLETGLWAQELFHGPTLAFKDMAMQLLGRLFDHVLAERGERVTIVGATSGDTGSAAIEAFAGPGARRHRDPASARPHQRGAAPADDHGAGAQCRQHRRRGHFRRLPGPGEGDVRRRAVPRASCICPPSTRSTGRGSRRRSPTTSPPRWRSARRTGRSRSRADRQFRQCAGRPGRRGGWACRSRG